ncbi:MAG: AI-2E family transporter [Candidatus Polarisedimenticolia bacterium]
MNRLPPAVKWIGGLLLVAAAGYLAFRLRSILGALGAALIIAYALEPAVSWLERRRVPRSLGAALIALAAVGAVVGAFLVAAPVFADQLSRFADSVKLEKAFDPKAWPDWLTGWIQSHQAQIETYKLKLVAWAEGNAARLATSAATALAKVTSSLAGLIVALLNLVVVPVIAYYLVVDFPKLKATLSALVPRPALPEVSRIGGEVDAVLRSFLRGQLIVALSMGAMYAAGLTALGTPLGVLVGFAAGLLNMVPYLGLAAGIIPALALNFLEHQSWGRLVGVLAVFIVTQNVEGWILTPRLLGTSLGLHPVVVVLAIMVGGELFGFPGIILAVPAAAAISVFVREGVRRYRDSRLYQGAPAAPESGDAR